MELEERKEPTHNMIGDYAVLMETSGEELEAWYYFIRVEDNEDNLKHLQSQLEHVDWYILDEFSTFDLDLDHYVSAQTAKEMSKLDLNATSFHRKFDGKLKRIDFGLTKKDKNKRKIKKINDILGYGSIENFIDDEDIDEEDLASDFNSDESDTDNESLSGSSSNSDSSDSDDDRKKRNEKIPPSIRLKQSIESKKDERKKGAKKGNY